MAKVLLRTNLNVVYQARSVHYLVCFVNHFLIGTVVKILVLHVFSFFTMQANYALPRLFATLCKYKGLFYS